MPRSFSLAQQAPPIEVMAPAADAAGRTGKWINTALIAGKLFLVLHVTQGNAATILISVLQATSAAGAGSKAGPTCKIWADLDTATSDALVAQTDGATFTTDAAVKNKIVLVEVDPSTLDVANGFKYVTLSTGASNAANVTQAEAIPVGIRYAQAAPLTMVT